MRMYKLIFIVAAEILTFIVASEKKIQVYTLIVASEKKNTRGGGAIRNPKKNPGIDFYSGFRKTSQGGGG